MGKILVIADAKGDGIATARGLQVASKLGHDVDVVAFVYASLKRLKVGADQEARLRDKLAAAVAKAAVDTGVARLPYPAHYPA